MIMHLHILFHPLYPVFYSRVHISSDEVFSKIMKKPSMINDTLYYWAACFHWDEAKKKFKWPTQKNLILNFMDWSLGLVEIIDRKGIGVA